MLTRNVLQRYFNVQMFGIALKLLTREKKLFQVSSLSIFTKIKSNNSTSESTVFPSGKQQPIHGILNAALRNYYIYCLTEKSVPEIEFIIAPSLNACHRINLFSIMNYLPLQLLCFGINKATICQETI